MGLINEVVCTKVAEEDSGPDYVLDSIEKDRDSSSNAEACLIKLPYALFIKQRPQGTAVGMGASKAFFRMKKMLNK